MPSAKQIDANPVTPSSCTPSVLSERRLIASRHRRETRSVGAPDGYAHLTRGLGHARWHWESTLDAPWTRVAVRGSPRRGLYQRGRTTLEGRIAGHRPAHRVNS